MPVVSGSSRLRARLDKLAQFTVNKLNDIVAEESKENDSFFDGSNPSGYMFNETMIMMQLIEKIIADYKYKMADAFDSVEHRDKYFNREQWK